MPTVTVQGSRDSWHLIGEEEIRNRALRLLAYEMQKVKLTASTPEKRWALLEQVVQRNVQVLPPLPAEVASLQAPTAPQCPHVEDATSGLAMMGIPRRGLREQVERLADELPDCTLDELVQEFLRRRG